MARNATKIMRLNKFIARYGNVSRRNADKLIFAGKVKVNNVLIKEPATDVKDTDKVQINNEIIKVDSGFKYYKFYKPKYCLTSYGDKFKRKNLNDYEFFRKNKLAYSGRLDFESEGLILFTNDGSLIYKLQRPEFKIPKKYLVNTSANLSDKGYKKFHIGFKIDETYYKPCKILRLNDKYYEITLFEGKNRQIRKMFEHFGIQVINLKRISIGPIEINDMKPNDIKSLNNNEVKELKECIELE
jgi:23S rRNA pseudouridine2605 synthase/23S rRNA pseudouridine2604 synthase